MALARKFHELRPPREARGNCPYPNFGAKQSCQKFASGEKIALTIYLSADVAGRLKLAAEAQKRPAVDLAAELARPEPAAAAGRPGPKQNIPYS